MNTEWLYWSVRTDAIEIKLCPALSYSVLGETVFIVLVFFVGEQLSLAQGTPLHRQHLPPS